MEVFDVTSNLRYRLADLRRDQVSIGLVPTMGALHEGHLSLLKASRAQNDITVGTIFVNPVQFNNPDDLAKYPRTLDRDLSMMEQEGCDIVFSPSEKEMYPTPPVIGFEAGEFGSVLEGEFRPGHFNGVLLVVSKLFNIINPDRAYFGQKDLQQLLLIRNMVTDLSIPVEVISVPTVREDSGLALSSRNERLDAGQTEASASLYRVLYMVRERLKQGMSFSDARREGEEYLRSFAAVKMEYLELLDVRSLKKADRVSGAESNYALLVAAYVGEVRLIDNIFL